MRESIFATMRSFSVRKFVMFLARTSAISRVVLRNVRMVGTGGRKRWEGGKKGPGHSDIDISL